jgi:hypothetical protein
MKTVLITGCSSGSSLEAAFPCRHPSYDGFGLLGECGQIVDVLTTSSLSPSLSAMSFRCTPGNAFMRVQWVHLST